MPIRIYAFAKELGLENSQLLDVCNKAGIKGKGSALASLDDDEVAKIKAFMTGGDDAGSEGDKKDDGDIAASESPETPVGKPPIGKPPIGQPPVVKPPVGKAPIGKPPIGKPPIGKPPIGKKPVGKQPPVPAAPTRKDIRPSRKGPLRDLSKPRPAKKSEDRSSKGDKRDPRKKPGVVVNVAAMPQVKQPEPKESGPKEKVQKPDIALPQDAIQKARAGESPLGQFTKSTKDKSKKKKGSSQEATPQNQIFGEMPSSGRRSGKRREKEERSDGPLAEMGSTRQQRTRRRRVLQNEDGQAPTGRRRPRRRSGPAANTAAPRKDDVVLQLPCTVREFSEASGVPAIQVILTLKQLGDESNKNINSPLEDEFVDLLIDHFEIENLEVRAAESLEEKLIGEFDEQVEDPASMEPRPPIVTFLGHVDHGKTSLLDALIGIDVVSGEAGGITQHIRAYEIKKGEQKIAFVDTPGHEAFTEMRARGANVTDIAVLVVAADDGVMPQTEEAISHAKAAEVPIIVAMNKIDLPGANPDKVYQDLAAHDLLPSEWGGEIEVIKTSATQGTGLDDLLETVLVTAELHEYKANPDRHAYGTCLEAEQQSGKGVVAKIIVQGGTLNVGDVVVCGPAHGRVKAMYDTLNPRKKLKHAGPSTPINLTGLNVPPGAGDKFHVLEDIAQAREIAEARAHVSKTEALSGITTRISLEEIQARLETGDLSDPNRDVITLNLIIRADVRGSIEAIQKELSKIQHPEVQIRVLQALVGGITVADIRLAQASEAVVIGFNVVPDEAARSLADELQVEVRRYSVIYKITDDLKNTLEGKLKPEEQVVELGMCMVLQTFNISKTGTIAGCRVMRGSIHRDCRIRIIRDSRVIGDYAIDTLKRVKDDAKEVQRGMECGIKLEGFNDIKEGDTFEAYKIEEVARTL